MCGGQLEANRCEPCGVRIVAEHLDSAIAALDRAACAGEAGLYRADGRVVRVRQQLAALKRLRDELLPIKTIKKRSSRTCSLI